MAFECIDIKRFLFVVLFSISRTSSTNIDCGGKPFHCLNSTHFMMCVYVGGRVSTTIDDFIIQCPANTKCLKTNRFECEFPKIDVPTTPRYVVDIIEENQKIVLPQKMDSAKTTRVDMTTVPIVLPIMETKTPFNNEILESLREEFTGGNEKFFDTDTIISTTTVSLSHTVQDEKISTSDTNIKLALYETTTPNAVKDSELGTSKMQDTLTAKVSLLTMSSKIPKDMLNTQSNFSKPNKTSDVLVKKLEIPSSLLHFTIEKSNNTQKYTDYMASNNRSNYVGSLKNLYKPDAMGDTTSKITIQTSTNFNNSENLTFHNEPFNSRINVTETANHIQLPEKAFQHKNITSNHTHFDTNSTTVSVMKTTTNLPLALFNDLGIKNSKDTKSEMFVNRRSTLPDKHDMTHNIVGSDILNNPFLETIPEHKSPIEQNYIITETNQTMTQHDALLKDGNEINANADIKKKYKNTHFIDKLNNEEYITTSNVVPDKNLIYNQTDEQLDELHKQDKIGVPLETVYQILNIKQTSETDSLTRINEHNFTTKSHHFLESSTKSTAPEELMATEVKKNTYIVSPNHNYIKTTPLTIFDFIKHKLNNTMETRKISVENRIESTTSLPVKITEVSRSVPPGAQFTSLTSSNNITMKRHATKTESTNVTFNTELVNTILLEPKDGQKSMIESTTNDTFVDKSSIESQLSKSPKLIALRGSYNIYADEVNDTFRTYHEQMNTVKSDYGTVIENTNGASSNNHNINSVADINQLGFSTDVGVMNNTEIKPREVIEVNNTITTNFTSDTKMKQVGKPYELTIMKTLKGKKKDEANQEVDFSTTIIMPENIIDSNSLTKFSTEPPLLTATIIRPINHVYSKDNILSEYSEGSKKDTAVTLNKYIYTGINDKIVSSMPGRLKLVETNGPNIEPPELVSKSALEQVNLLPVIRNNKTNTKIFTISTTEITQIQVEPTIHIKPDVTVKIISSPRFLLNSSHYTDESSKLDAVQNLYLNVTNNTKQTAMNTNFNVVTAPATVAEKIDNVNTNVEQTLLDDISHSGIRLTKKAVKNTNNTIQFQRSGMNETDIGKPMLYDKSQNNVFSKTYHEVASQVEHTPRSSIFYDGNKISENNNKYNTLRNTTEVTISKIMNTGIQASKNISKLNVISLKNETEHSNSPANRIINSDKSTTIKTVSSFVDSQNRTHDNLEQQIELPYGFSKFPATNIIDKPIHQNTNVSKLASAKHSGATTKGKSNDINTSFTFNCPKFTSGKYADSKDCRKFYICVGKLQPVLGICPNSTVFSEINRQCTRNLSHCVRNNQFHCLHEGRFSDYLKDNIYYICVQNKLHGFLRYTFQCDKGYHMNKVTVKCEQDIEPWNQSMTSTSISNDVNGSVINSDVSEISENGEFDCQKEGKFPHIKNCRQYYECTKNENDEYIRKIRTCSSDEIYDRKKKNCVASESEEC